MRYAFRGRGRWHTLAVLVNDLSRCIDQNIRLDTCERTIRKIPMNRRRIENQLARTAARVDHEIDMLTAELLNRELAHRKRKAHLTSTAEIE
jgi:hypothetical protein